MEYISFTPKLKKYDIVRIRNEQENKIDGGLIIDARIYYYNTYVENEELIHADICKNIVVE